jgi:hypothetical protein
MKPDLPRLTTRERGCPTRFQGTFTVLRFWCGWSHVHRGGPVPLTRLDAGYAGELPANQPSLAEAMRANGYSTVAVGKWHLCRDSDLHDAGDRHSSPLQRGFDQYYGFLEALTNFHHPHRLLDGNSAVRMIREVKTANPAKPFFLYFDHAAVHAPLHAKTPFWVAEENKGEMRRIGYEATARINRHDLGVSWQDEIPGGGVVVSNEIELNLDVEAIPVDDLEHTGAIEYRRAWTDR